MILNKNKSQLGIFVIISIFIIFLFIFFIFFGIEDKKEVVEEVLYSQLSETNSKIIPLKDNVDTCLERELKKALIIAGLRGGFIYDKSYINSEEFYLEFKSSNSFPKYDLLFLTEKLGINLEYVDKKVLVYLEDFKKFPKISEFENNRFPSVYQDSIEKQFEDFILENFISCLKLEEYSSNGYTVQKEEYASNLQNFNLELDSSDYSKYLEIRTEERLGLKGDTQVSLIIGNKKYSGGEIINEEGNLVKFSSSPQEMFNSIQNLKNVKPQELILVNEDKNVNIDVTFTDDYVRAEVFYPISIKNKDFDSSYSYSNKVVNVKFKKFLDFSKILLDRKLNNRGLNLIEELDEAECDLMEILKPCYLFQKLLYEDNQDIYFKNLKNKNLNLLKTDLSENDINKIYIYSFIDSSNKIFGEDYIFNFAYLNSAPYINEDEPEFASGDYVKTDAGEFYTLVVDRVHTGNLFDIVGDRNSFDERNLIVEEKSISSGNYKFDLHSNGEFILESKTNRGIFKVDFFISDGEAMRQQTLIFLVGIIENTNNEEAKLCLNFKNFPITDKTEVYHYFPIQSLYSNKLFDFQDGSEFNNLLGYTLYSDLVQDNEDLSFKHSEIRVNPYCFFKEDTYSFIYKFVDENGNIIDFGDDPEDGVFSFGILESERDIIKIPFLDQNFKIHLNLIKKSDIIQGNELSTVNLAFGDNRIIETDLQVDIFRRECLGPNDVPMDLMKDLEFTEDFEFGSDVYDMKMFLENKKFREDIHVQNCCDLSKAPSNKILSSDEDSQNINDGGIIVDTDVYLVHNFPLITTSTFSKIDLKEENIWEIIGEEGSSIFNSHLKSVCDGKFPRWEDNIISIKSSNEEYKGQIFEYSSSDTPHNEFFPFFGEEDISLDVYRQSGICEFSNIIFSAFRPQVMYSYDDENYELDFHLGFKSVYYEDNSGKIVFEDDQKYYDYFLADLKLEDFSSKKIKIDGVEYTNEDIQIHCDGGNGFPDRGKTYYYVGHLRFNNGDNLWDWIKPTDTSLINWRSYDDSETNYPRDTGPDPRVSYLSKGYCTLGGTCSGRADFADETVIDDPKKCTNNHFSDNEATAFGRQVACTQDYTQETCLEASCVYTGNQDEEDNYLCDITNEVIIATTDGSNDAVVCDFEDMKCPKANPRGLPLSCDVASPITKSNQLCSDYDDLCDDKYP